MKKITFILITLLISFQASSQGLYPKGCYMSFEEIKTKSPSKNYKLKVKKRTTSDIKMNGGNDYKLISADKSIKRKVLKKKIFAFSTGDSLFINCLPMKLQKWYSRIISDGKYFVFIAGIPMDKTMQSKEMQLGMAFGAIGGAFAGASLAMQRYLYILNKETNNVEMVDLEVMNKVLKDYPYLLDQYNSESKKNEIQTQIEYLELLNKK